MPDLAERGICDKVRSIWNLTKNFGLKRLDTRVSRLSFEEPQTSVSPNKSFIGGGKL